MAQVNLFPFEFSAVLRRMETAAAVEENENNKFEKMGI